MARSAHSVEQLKSLESICRNICQCQEPQQNNTGNTSQLKIKHVKSYECSSLYDRVNGTGYLQYLHVLTSVVHDRGPWLLFGELHAFTFIFLDPCDCFGTCPGVYATYLTSPCWDRIQAYWDPKQDKLVYKKDGWLDAMESPWRQDVCVIRMTGNLFLLVCKAPMNSGRGQLPPFGPHMFEKMLKKDPWWMALWIKL